MLFSIGPVQSFIAEARRAHDLWAGSKMLVDITREALQQVAKKHKIELLFPAKDDQPSIPNVFALIAPQDQVEAIAQVAEEAAKNKLKRMAEQAYNRLRDLDGFGGVDPLIIDNNFKDIWERQLEHHLEFNWVACSKLEQSWGHGQWFDYARRALEARKCTRDFFQSEEPGMKDSFSGQRSALHVADKEVQTFWKDVHKNLRKEFRTMLQPNGRERLDAIGLTKRFRQWVEEDDFFPSVGSVAAASFLRDINAKDSSRRALNLYNELLKEAEEAGLAFRVKFKKALPNIKLPDFWQFDGEWLYEERLSEDLNRRELNVRELSDEQSQKLRRLRGALSALYHAVGKRPNPYYAILMLDGDKMGKHISSCKEDVDHKTLSHQLSQFADQTASSNLSFQSVIEHEYCGCMIYAGGDDLLALLPVDEALAAANRIHEIFVQGTANLQPNFPFTASAGLVFAHHRSQLDAALQAARHAEKRAKDERYYDRASLCVTALKRSGAPVYAGAKWQYDLEPRLETIKIMQEIIGALQAEPRGLSSKFVFDVAETAAAFIDLPPKAFEADLRRLLERHGLKENAAKKLALDLSLLSQEWDRHAVDRAKAEGYDKPHEQLRGPVELANWLILARFIAQGGNA